MKHLLGLAFAALLACKSYSQTDAINLKQVNEYIRKEVTIRLKAAHFDSRQHYWYLYAANRYPNQLLTVMVKKCNGIKYIKLDRDVLLGRKMVYFTGKIIKYDGAPDSSANPEVKSLKKI